MNTLPSRPAVYAVRPFRVSRSDSMPLECPESVSPTAACRTSHTITSSASLPVDQRAAVRGELRGPDGVVVAAGGGAHRAGPEVEQAHRAVPLADRHVRSSGLSANPVAQRGSVSPATG